jgi:5-methylcytosine-specific restriction protein B
MLTVTDWRQITARTLFNGAQVLAEHPGGLARQDLWRLVVERLPGIEAEWGEATTGRTTALDSFGRYSINLVKAGWLRKAEGRWYLTPSGREALDDYTDPDAFWDQHAELYDDWDRNRDRFHRARQLMAAIPSGNWAAADDVAYESELEPKRLVRWVQGERPPRWHQLLDADGGLPDALPLTDAERDVWLGALRSGGVAAPGGRAESGDRIPAADLARLVDEPPPDTIRRRAWLIRGSSVQGTNLVPLWLEEGICSLPATRLRHDLKPGATRNQVGAAVDEDYADSGTTRQRAQLTADYHAFLSRMRDRDIVATNIGSDYYLGYITGPPAFTSSEGSRSSLRRPVVWANADSPIDYDQLPDEIPARLGNPDAQVVELTEFASDLEPFLGEIPDPEMHLPDVTPLFAKSLFMANAPASLWLQDCVDLLRDKPQLIFYGPPGTGKTFLAQKLAVYLAGGKEENVDLVQFHPAYSYEDFFMGYRPQESAAGEVAFRAYHGPLWQIADAARRHRGEPHVLIIDEINRSNLPKIFGELYFLLEYRDKSIVPTYASEEDPDFSLPSNLVIIGTMNTADRSIAMVDAALRRRFSFMELHPDEEPVRGLLPAWLAELEFPDDSARLLDALNRRIRDRDFKIGPSYLMRPAVQSVAGLKRVWRNQILPLLEEHHYGDRDHEEVVREYGLDALRRDLDLPEPGGFGT